LEDLHVAIEKLIEVNDKFILMQVFHSVWGITIKSMLERTANEVSTLTNTFTDFHHMIAYGHVVHTGLNLCMIYLRDFKQAWELAKAGRLLQYILLPDRFIEALRWLDNNLPHDLKLRAPADNAG
jgi:hypothetical protein